MRRTFSFYHRETGEVHPQRYSTDAAEPRLSASVAANTPADHQAVEAELDHLSQRVDLTGEKPMIVDHQPPQPSADHEWDAATRRWQLTAVAASREADRQAARARIQALEQSQHAAVRDAILGRGSEKLAAIDAEIAELQKQL